MDPLSPGLADKQGNIPALRVLMVTYPFPPMSGTSGVQRPQKFARFLADDGVKVDVLTCSAHAYEQVTESAAPANICVHRAFALDAARHFAVRGRYPRWLALPDRWVSWVPFAILRGLRVVRQVRPHLIWSTYPIASANLVAGAIARLSGLPWIADFRDPMFEEEYEQHHSFRARLIRWIDAYTVRNASCCVFTTRGTETLYASRYPGTHAAKRRVIENGFDESDFEAIQVPPTRTAPLNPFRLLHSGTVYSFERDPRPLFAALGALLKRGVLSPHTFQLVLRAPGDEQGLRRLLSEAQCEPLVQIGPAVAHRAAIEEMLSADALLLLQADNCNRQIPAKAYEYLRAGRPVLALTDSAGDTASLLRSSDRVTLCSLSSADEIAACLPGFLTRATALPVGAAPSEGIEKFSRRTQATKLLSLMRQMQGATK